MHIICPHCTTSYAIDLSTLGVAGRAVRCSRCRQVGLARPQDVRTTDALVVSLAEGDPATNFVAAPRKEPADFVARDPEPPTVESPSISAEWPDTEAGSDAELQAVHQRETAVKAPRA